MRDGRKKNQKSSENNISADNKNKRENCYENKKVISLLCTAAMLLAVPAGNVYAGAEDQSVVVTMPTTSEPESGFDPGLRMGSRRACS